MELVPTTEAPPETLWRRLVRLAYGYRWRLAYLAGVALLGWFCRHLPEGWWRDACAWVATRADGLAEVLP